ncbi:MAG: EAL domain-containing protein [Phycisphaerae bacterium]|nr:EAL domain-containing protein [Phycisphaerae bacterium]
MTTSGVPDHPDAAQQGATPDDRLARMLAARDMGAVFQPIVDTHESRVVGLELFSRPDARWGFDDISQVLAEAALEGLSLDMDVAVLRAAGEAARRGWPPGMKLFLNVATQSLLDERFTTELIDLVGAAEGLEPGLVVVEIGFACPAADWARLVASTERLRSSGFGLALDGVGLNDRLMTCLESLRPDWIKLSAESTRALARDRARRSLLGYVCHLAEMLGLRAVASGVESADDLAEATRAGVRYAQGRLIGGPAAHGSLDGLIRSAASDRIASLRGTGRDPERTSLSLFRAPGASIQSAARIGDALDMLGARPELTGLVVQDERRFVGWCGRADAELAARKIGREATIEAATTPGVATLPPGATVDEALALLAARDDTELAHPLVLAHAGRVEGIVRVQDVLRAASREASPEELWTHALTGLPGRTRVEQQLARLAGACASPQAGPAREEADFAGAVVGIRSLRSINAVYGRELGDRLIRAVADHLRQVCAGLPRRPAPFLGSLGADRFVLMGDGSLLIPKLRTMIARFDADGARGRGWLWPEDDSRERPGLVPMAAVELRVMVIPRIGTRAGTVMELDRIEAQLRQKTLAERARRGTPGSVLVVDTRGSSTRSDAGGGAEARPALRAG